MRQAMKQIVDNHRNGVPWIGHVLERERQAAGARGLASFLLFLLLPYDFLVFFFSKRTF